MATNTVESLFNLPTAEQARQQYLEGMMTSPGQMNQLSLLQQVAAMGRDAGATVGFAGGRLFGGRTADEVRIQGVNEAMAEATQMGGTDAEMYANLAKGLASRGLTQDAMAATEKARAAKRDEQVMTLAQSAEERAVLGEKRAVLAEERAVLEAQRNVLADERDKQLFDEKMKGLPNELKLTELKLLEAEKNLNGFRGEEALYGQALKNGIDPRTGKPFANETERMKAQARFDEAKNQLKKEADAVTREREKHELTIQSLRANIAQSNAAASNSRNTTAFKYNATVQVPAMIPTDPPRTMKVGRMNSLGEVIGNDGNPYPNVNAAAEAQGIGVAVPAALPPAALTNPAAPAKKPVKPLSEF